MDELNALDGKGIARQLIESGSGTITPYGVVYDNGMKLEQVYDGRFFPCYYYEPNAITVAVTSKAEPEDTEHITWLYLPMEQEEIDRALLRGASQTPPMSACGWRTASFPMRWMSCWISKSRVDAARRETRGMALCEQAGLWQEILPALPNAGRRAAPAGGAGCDQRGDVGS